MLTLCSRQVLLRSCTVPYPACAHDQVAIHAAVQPNLLKVHMINQMCRRAQYALSLISEYLLLSASS